MRHLAAICLAIALGSLHGPVEGQQCSGVTPTSMPFPGDSCMESCPDNLPPQTQCEYGSVMDVVVEGVSYCCKCVEKYDPNQNRNAPSPTEFRLCPQTAATRPRLLNEPVPPEGSLFLVYVTFDLGADTRVPMIGSDGVTHREFLPDYVVEPGGHTSWFKFENVLASEEA
eukprot:CAMPEP_0174933540 /NCGR_PEP_ID=MMETSP1355-20121228/46036_1 /TAXON_ID=464990 /ORGANISM="Hemiselmis tepida, Strain CCMP443" /LENGTH=169 /DNA_ID=CAMNT_0016180057 /DNA_START=52 /DNA_END=557 /DNA_ORIENTATION=+